MPAREVRPFETTLKAVDSVLFSGADCARTVVELCIKAMYDVCYFTDTDS